MSRWSVPRTSAFATTAGASSAEEVACGLSTGHASNSTLVLDSSLACTAGLQRHVGSSSNTIRVCRSGARSKFMRGTRVVVSQDAHFEMGDHSAIHCNATLTCLEHISIGRECAISWNSNIIDGNGHELSIDSVPRPVSVPVVIGDHVWIGAGASVLSGVTIGSGAVVAGGSIVTRDVPDRTLVAGSPAKVVGKNVEWVR